MSSKLIWSILVVVCPFLLLLVTYCVVYCFSDFFSS